MHTNFEQAKFSDEFKKLIECLLAYQPEERLHYKFLLENWMYSGKTAAFQEEIQSDFDKRRNLLGLQKIVRHGAFED